MDKRYKMKLKVRKKIDELSIEEQWIRKLQNYFIRSKEKKIYDKEAAIYQMTEGDIKDLIRIEWKSEILKFGDKWEVKFKHIKDVLEKHSEFTESAARRGHNNFINGLRNHGALEEIEGIIGERLNPDKLMYREEATYQYGNEWIITYMGGGGYQQRPIVVRISDYE